MTPRIIHDVVYALAASGVLNLLYVDNISFLRKALRKFLSTKPGTRKTFTCIHILHVLHVQAKPFHVETSLESILCARNNGQESKDADKQTHFYIHRCPYPYTAALLSILVR